MTKHIKRYTFNSLLHGDVTTEQGGTVGVHIIDLCADDGGTLSRGRKKQPPLPERLPAQHDLDLEEVVQTPEVGTPGDLLAVVLGYSEGTE